MASREQLSARPCGCDPGANHPCERHRDVLEGFQQVAELYHAFEIAKKDRQTLGEVAAKIREREGVTVGDPSVGLSLDAQQEIRKFHAGDATLIPGTPGQRIVVNAHGTAQKFATGATRSGGEGKIDFEGHIHPDVLHRFGEYMHQHRVQANGQRRASDNWQLGIPLPNYMKSLIRHTFDLWRAWRGTMTFNPDNGERQSLDELLCAILFNTQGMLLELRRGNAYGATHLDNQTRQDLERGLPLGGLEWPGLKNEKRLLPADRGKGEARP